MSTKIKELIEFVCSPSGLLCLPKSLGGKQPSIHSSSKKWTLDPLIRTTLLNLHMHVDIFFTSKKSYESNHIYIHINIDIQYMCKSQRYLIYINLQVDNEKIGHIFSNFMTKFNLYMFSTSVFPKKNFCQRRTFAARWRCIGSRSSGIRIKSLRFASQHQVPQWSTNRCRTKMTWTSRDGFVRISRVSKWVKWVHNPKEYPMHK